MRKVFTDFPITGPFELSASDSRHVLLVLRHKVGDLIQVTDSTGTTYACLLTRMENHVACLSPAHKVNEPEASAGPVILAAGLLKNDKFEWVVQKAVELGANCVVPVQMAHCVVKLNETRRRDKVERWQRIAMEASKQCGRDDVPSVGPVMDLAELAQTYGEHRFLVPYEEETAPLHEACHQVLTGGVVICIGPEGGYAPEEIDFLRNHVSWMRTVSLGKRILRAETASLAALSIIMYERGICR